MPENTSGRKEVSNMIECTTFMRTLIENVEEVLIGKNEQSILTGFNRSITIKTKQGETVCIFLRADDPSKLEFKDEPELDESGWLKPKVYKGKSMHEMEMDGEE